MKVHLKKRWGAHLQHAVVSVSNERAEYLEDKGIGKIIDEPKENITKVLDPKSKPDQEQETKPEPEKAETPEEPKNSDKKKK